eukprot:CAMPEP_0206157540 /NCGR_PEP_ID=MMETSP1474-20131121/3994_1 /ASSEMBLY_ACC=CAM_ASM_001110 /TAXON_ID=97495 /ORGANISM="Imantonia sp., Strain RCC918" /LENGTH=109 /DNA_ID=CAMNT_0053557155 /DNA_START=436 /DNA_END=766 /DNA_ORIENTATION=+
MSSVKPTLLRLLSDAEPDVFGMLGATRDLGHSYSGSNDQVDHQMSDTCYCAKMDVVRVVYSIGMARRPPTRDSKDNLSMRPRALDTGKQACSPEGREDRAVLSIAGTYG